MKGLKNPGGYKYNGRKMNSDYAKGVYNEIERINNAKPKTTLHPQHQYDDRDGIAISPEGSLVAIALMAGVVGAIGFCLFWVKDWMGGWSSYDMPWNLVAGYYNVIFGWPLDTFPKVWGWLQTTMNTAIAVVGIAIYAMMVLVIYMTVFIKFLFKFSSKIGLGSEGIWMLLSNLLLLPLVLGGLFTLVRGVFRWIF